MQHRCCTCVTKHRCWYGRGVDEDEVRAPAATLTGALEAALAQLDTLPAAPRTAAATLLAQVLLDAQASVASRRAAALGDLVRTQGTYAAAAAVLAEIGQELADAQLAATTPEAVGQTIRRARAPRRTQSDDA